uniref:ATP synthase F0 subunit 8 n=1 Tax=Tigrigobius multifasciatus TaxID=203335 RepID=UPI0028FC9F80|nr:ATP synthase F0 subunit 8 [Tigrigobius multifasciatus]WNH38007.1 ATP synthase F0 subunit 8 [Tigrigobius multifasciatus]
MPQLDPRPWLIILVYSWSILLIFIVPKVLSNKPPKKPTPKGPTSKDSPTSEAKSGPWPWPWR